MGGLKEVQVLFGFMCVCVFGISSKIGHFSQKLLFFGGGGGKEEGGIERERIRFHLGILDVIFSMHLCYYFLAPQK